MKIACAIFRYFPYGGLQRDFRRVADELAARGHEVTVFCQKWDAPRPERLKLEIIPLRSMTNHGKAKEFCRKFRKIIAAEHFDRTIAFNRVPGCDFFFAADDCMAVTLREKHSALAIHLLPRCKTYLRLEKELFDPAQKTKYLLIAPHQKTDFQKYYNTPDNRFILLPPGIDPACVRKQDHEMIRAEKRKEFAFAPDEIVLIMIAAQFALKGLDRVIRAFASLPEEIRKHCKVLAVGDTKTKKFANLAKQCGCLDRIVFSGPGSDIPELLAAADLMVHPARREAAGAVLAESLASGLPVIASGICGFSHLVKEAGCPVLKEPFDQAELNLILADSIKDLNRLKAAAVSASEHNDYCSRTTVFCDLL